MIGELAHRFIPDRIWRLWYSVKPAPRVDTDHVDGLGPKYLTTGIEQSHVNRGTGSLVRCDLCGRLFQSQRMPKAIEHVAKHDSQGAAEIDPFDSEMYPYTVSEEEMAEPIGDAVRAVYENESTSESDVSGQRGGEP